ncbi:MAG: serine/threonine protein kinase [Candidatus Eremiobacteraeota bacterium]|nr:serine/threonine protein kinase [Candidatus Eremiobacteraeota bacterium]
MEKFIEENRYMIIEKVHEGAQGYIYKAKDTKLDEIVALKEMFSEFESDEEKRNSIKRFREEARILFTLEHPGIPRVTDFFEEGGKLFMVMTYIEGEDLELYIKKRQEKPIVEDTVLDWARQVLEILDYLHNLEPPIIYRDLKPSNLMIGKNGQILLVDFGIARIFEPEMRGTIIGTPGFSSPEQYKGFSDPRSDIYSLGATMHYLLTGRDPSDPSLPPFKFDDLRELNPDISEKTSKLVAGMLEFEIDSRPSSAKSLINVIEGEEELMSPEVKPSVKKIPPLEIKKKRSKAFYLVGIIMLLILSSIVTFGLFKIKKKNKSSRIPGESHIVSNTANPGENKKGKILDNGKFPVREAGVLSGHGEQVTCIAFSPDGKYIATGSDDNTIKIWDFSTQKLIQTLTGHMMTVRWLAFSNDGNHLVSTSNDKTRRIWDWKKGQQEACMELPFTSEYAIFAPGDNYIIVGKDCQQLYIYNRSGEKMTTFVGLAFDISPDGKKFASYYENSKGIHHYMNVRDTGLRMTSLDIDMWAGYNHRDMEKLDWLYFGKREKDPITSVQFSPDGKHIAASTQNSKVEIWSTGGKLEKVLTSPGCFINIDYSPDGKYLGASTTDKGLYVWDTSTGEMVRNFFPEDYMGPVWMDIKFSPDGKHLAVTDGKYCKLYEMMADFH